MKAIKIILIITFLVKTCNLFAQGEYCFECEGNTSRGLKSSTFGVDNHAWGDYSNVFGQSNIVRGKWATTFGFENSSDGDCSFVAGRASRSLRNYSAVIGSWSTADGLHSFVIGSQSKSLSNYGYIFGRSSKVQNSSAMLIGYYLSSGANSQIVVGNGLDTLQPFTCNQPYSLAVGFNSTVPTFFVGQSSGAGKTGKIGIGNITNPQVKLHILSDEGEAAELKLEHRTTGDNQIARIYLGSHKIEASSNSHMNFYTTNSSQHYNFYNGTIRSVNGSATAPAYSFSDNPNTGMFKFGTNSLAFSIGGAQKVAIASEGLTVSGFAITSLGYKVNQYVVINSSRDYTGRDGSFTGVLSVIGTGNSSFNGNVGIGTTNPPGRLSLQSDAGVNVAMSYENGGSARYWTGLNATNNAFILGGTGGTLPESGAINIQNGNVGIGMLPGSNKTLEVNGDINFTGDLYRQGSLWDINLWEKNGNIVYYNQGNVGIGTNTPQASLHIYDPSGNWNKTHLKIESTSGNYGGTTEIGRLYGSGLIIEQKAAANTPNRLLFRQSAYNAEERGLSISTYTTTNGNVDYTDIFSESSTMYIRAVDDLYLRSNNGDLYLETVAGGKQVQLNEYGQLGIGTTNHIDQGETKLTVKGRIHAKEVKVTATAGGADFVFEDDYNLPKIEQVAEFIRENKHLPNIPSAKEMEQQGLDIGEMQIKLLQKIEELTLYVIDLKKENEEMQDDNAEMKAEIEKLKRR